MPPARAARPAVSGLGWFLAGFAAASLLLSSRVQQGPAAGREAAPSDEPGLPASAAASTTQAPPERQQLLLFVGVQTGFTTDRSNPKYDYAARRAALRASWFPANRSALDRLAAEQRILLRFVAGRSADAEADAALSREAEAHGGFLRLPGLTEGYADLTLKTLTFFTYVARRYDAQYIVKVDDDVFLRLDRLPAAAAQWASVSADYVGCLKTGQVMKTPRYRWYEPQWRLIGDEYYVHAWGSAYVLAGRAAARLAALPPGSLRFLANEDVTVGTWMLALNVTHYDDRRLCETRCSDSSLAVYDMPVCSGLCEPARQLGDLQADPACHSPATGPTGALPLVDPVFMLSERTPDPGAEESALRVLEGLRQHEAARQRGGQRAQRGEPRDTVRPL